MNCPLHGENFIYITDCDICASLKTIYATNDYEKEDDMNDFY